MFLYKEFLIGEHQKGLLYIDGRFERPLGPGLHQVYRLFRRVDVVRVDVRVRTVQVLGQELMTADAVTLRMNLVGRYRVRNPALAVHEVEDYHDVGLKDLVLPGDMKAILNRVLEARKRAEAAQIERREEVAATRSLANTAAMLEKNPTLMRLKEMELLEKILAGYGHKVVLGLPGRLQKLIGLDEGA